MHKVFDGTFRAAVGHQDGVAILDDEQIVDADRGHEGPWLGDDWKGWWGTNPPYHVPTFVLTHHHRASIVMDGGTTFHFVTDGIHAALARAKEAAGGKDVRIGGGVSTIRQYLRAGLVDEIHLALGPGLLGRGEALLTGIDLRGLGFECSERVGTAHAMHVVLTKQVRPDGG